MLSTGIAGVADAVVSGLTLLLSLPFLAIVAILGIGILLHAASKLMNGGNSGIFPPPNYQPWAEPQPQIVYLPQPQPMAALLEPRVVRQLPAVIALKGEN